jgi:hypothetical protein
VKQYHRESYSCPSVRMAVVLVWLPRRTMLTILNPSDKNDQTTSPSPGRGLVDDPSAEKYRTIWSTSPACTKGSAKPRSPSTPAARNTRAPPSPREVGSMRTMTTGRCRRRSGLGGRVGYDHGMTQPTGGFGLQVPRPKAERAIARCMADSSICVPITRGRQRADRAEFPLTRHSPY